jgi:uncharacterized membrane protein YebE (DUF533 family)
MMIRVTGVAYTAYNNRQQAQTKFYQPQTQKQTVKKDFGLLLDKEIKKLHFDKIV